MGHGKEAAYRIPPASEFCSIKGIPQLEDLEAALHKKGLKDPWIRNEIWRYNKGFGSRWERFRLQFFRGFGIGLALTVATVIYDRTYGGGGGGAHHDQCDDGHGGANEGHGKH